MATISVATNLQQQTVTVVNLTATASTGTVTAALAWSPSIEEGQVFGVWSSAEVYKGALSIASISSTVLTFYRLIDIDDGELTPAIIVGDVIRVAHTPVTAGFAADVNIVAYESGATTSRLGTYYFAGHNINIAANCLLQVTPRDSLLFGTQSTVMPIAGSGTLVVGTYKTTNGVTSFRQFEAIQSDRLVSPAGGNPIGASSLEFFCGTINLNQGWINSARLRTYSQEAVVTSTNTTNGVDIQVRYGLEDWAVRGLTTEGGISVTLIRPISTFKRWRSRGVFGLGALAGSNYRLANTWTPVYAPEFDGSNVYDIRGSASYWWDFINPRYGFNVRWLGGLTLMKLSQQIKVTVKNPSGVAIKSKLWITETNSGNRLAPNTIQSNPDFTATTIYTSDQASGMHDLSILGSVVYDAGAGIKIDDRQPTVAVSNVIKAISPDIRISSYGFLPSSVSQTIYGESRQSIEQKLVADASCVQTDIATVQGYTELENSIKAYDAYMALRHTTFAGNISFNMARSGSLLTVFGRDLVIDASAASLIEETVTTITIRASVFTGSITAAGSVTLVNGAAVTGAVYDVNNAGQIMVTGASVADTVEMHRVADGVLLATRTGPGAFAVPPALVGVSVYFERKVGAALVVSTIIAPVTLTAGENPDAPMYSGSQVQVANLDNVAKETTLQALASANQTEHDATQSAIAALPAPLNSTQTQAAAAAALVAYDAVVPADLAGLATSANVTAAQTAIIAEVDAIPTNPLLTTDTRLNNLDAAISTRSTLTAPQVRTELATELGRLDVAVSTRLATASYVAPTTAPTAADNAAAVRTNLATELARIDATVSSRLATTGYTAPANADIAAIKAKTDTLVNTVAPTAAQIRAEMETNGSKLDTAAKKSKAAWVNTL